MPAHVQAPALGGGPHADHGVVRNVAALGKLGLGDLKCHRVDVEAGERVVAAVAADRVLAVAPVDAVLAVVAGERVDAVRAGEILDRVQVEPLRTALEAELYAQLAKDLAGIDAK